MRNTHFKGRTTTHQGTPGGRTGGADMKVVKPGTFCPECVQVGGADPIIAHAGEISFALIIGKNEENIGPTASELITIQAGTHEKIKEGYAKSWFHCIYLT